MKHPEVQTVVVTLHRSPHMLPEPDGRIEGSYYWLRTTVEKWLPTAPPRRHQRPRRPAKKRPQPGERGE